jgi:3-oxoacyl-[acyl-carrier-protein] synthase II
MAAGRVAELLDARGPSFCVGSACASSGHALGEALQMIRAGRVDAVVAGGAEACLNPLAAAAFAQMGTLSQRNASPQQASRPFDADRDGFVMAEGAAVLVLESMDRARARGARIYAELAGYGASADAHHATSPEGGGRGATQAMKTALADALLNPSDVDYINAHGTSTRENDITETLAIKAALGDHSRAVWISSTKSMSGHMLGAAAAFEAAVSALAIRHGIVPPTINLDRPDERCDLDYVPGDARERRLRAILSNSFGFGGQNVSLVFRPVDN